MKSASGLSEKLIVRDSPAANASNSEDGPGRVPLNQHVVDDVGDDLKRKNSK